MKHFILTDEIINQIKDYRHHVRLMGTKGGCYQVSLFIEHHYGLPMREGVYQSSHYEPIMSHRWNLLPDGSILDGTADQFCEGYDVSIIDKNSNFYLRYRPQWSDSLNPKVTSWLAEHKWLGITDFEWKTNNSDKKISSGWWLQDNNMYLQWRSEMMNIYKAYRN